MKYGFVALKAKDGSSVYMEPRGYDRYSCFKEFKEGVLGLCVYEHIHIGCFPLMFTFHEIIEYNPDAKLVDYIPSTDICFIKSSYSDIAKIFNCENIPEVK